MIVSLDAADNLRARELAELRVEKWRETPHRYGLDANAWSASREASAIGAEIALARALGIEWTGDANPGRAGDVGPHEVRQTRYQSGRLLLHRDGDDPRRRFFLVVGELPVYRIVGHIRAADGFELGEERELQRGRPCVCVEQRDLTPFDRRDFDLIGNYHADAVGSTV
jgi:hypothetical protein